MAASELRRSEPVAGIALEEMTFTIRPGNLLGTIEFQVEGKIWTDNKGFDRFGFKHTYRPNDFASKFDMIMDVAKLAIEDFLLNDLTK